MAITIMYRADLKTPCDEFPACRDGNGYGRVSFNGRTIYAHRLAYCEHHGLTLDDIKGVVIRHRCDNPPCRNPEHLIAGTQGQNVQDMMRRGRWTSNHNKGEKHYKAKLTEDQVREIRKRHARGESSYLLAKRYGVNHGTIYRILDGTNWKHV